MATVRRTVAGLIGLIRDLADPDPCTYDHHGHCQAHGWFAYDRRCPHARAQDLLDQERPGWRDGP